MVLELSRVEAVHLEGDMHCRKTAKELTEDVMEVSI
jgi:hypothetical protein